MRIIEVIKDFLKIFIYINGSGDQNYHRRVVKFSRNKNQITEKKMISKILKKKQSKKNIRLWLQ